MNSALRPRAPSASTSLRCGYAAALLLALLTPAACAPSPATPPPVAPSAPPPTTGPDAASPGTPGGAGSDPLALPDTFRTEALGVDPTTEVEALPPRPKGVPAPSAKLCTEPSKAPSAAVCGTPDLERRALAEALENPSVAARNGALLALEACHLPPGLVRALRAELAPPGCADLLLEPYLSSAQMKDTAPEIRGAMVGLVFAAWAYRAVTPAPTLTPPYPKDKVLAHIKGPGLRWVQTQSAALDDLGKRAIKLPLYGRGVAAIELGSAYLRFVQAIRDLPLPDEFKNDKELEDAYFGSLDQVFEPQKAAGRDAALVGLRDFAMVGAIDDPRTKRARALLGGVYGGKRATALEALVLSPTPSTPGQDAATTTNVDARLAQRLPTFYASQLLPAPKADAPIDDELLAALALRGLPLPYREAIQSAGPPGSTKTLSPRGSLSVALGRARMGREYARAIDFERSLAAIKTATPSEDTELLRALGLALHAAPESMAQVVRGNVPPLDVRGLDAVAKAHPTGPLGAAAAYDAALLFELSPGATVGNDPTFFQQVATRYRDAAARGGPFAAAATRAAENAEAIAKELGTKK